MAERKFHPDMQAMFDARAAVPIPADLAGERRAWDEYARLLSRPHPESMQVQDRALPTAAGDVPVRIYWPGGRRHPSPCVVYYHGGGFIKGGLDGSDGNAWGMAEQTGAVVVSVDYRLAPEHKYPAAFDDCFACLEWVVENAGRLDIDPARIAVSGDSAGGNLAAAVALAARDRGGPRIVAQALIYPVTGLPPEGGSYDENSDAPGLTTSSMARYNELYFPEPDIRDPYARPVLADDFSRLPPAFIHTAEHDPLRDDGEVYAAKLNAAGTPAIYRCAAGMIHGFYRARFSGADTAAEFDALCAFLREHLGT